MHQFVESYCKPMLVHNIATANTCKSVLSKIQSTWDRALYKLYDANGNDLRCMPIRSDMVINKFKFLKNCEHINNTVVDVVFAVCGELMTCAMTFLIN